MSTFTKFDRYAPRMIEDLMRDFGLTDFQAAAFPGNAGAESAGFTDIIEDAALAKGWAGGNGWFQWTGMKPGQRRAKFEAWLKRKKLSPDSYEGNYSFLFRELIGTESKVLDEVRKATTVEEATRIVCEKFERPAVNNYRVRERWANRALNKYRDQQRRALPAEPELEPAPELAPKLEPDPDVPQS